MGGSLPTTDVAFAVFLHVHRRSGTFLRGMRTASTWMFKTVRYPRGPGPKPSGIPIDKAGERRYSRHGLEVARKGSVKLPLLEGW